MDVDIIRIDDISFEQKSLDFGVLQNEYLGFFRPTKDRCNVSDNRHMLPNTNKTRTIQFTIPSVPSTAGTLKVKISQPVVISVAFQGTHSNQHPIQQPSS